MLGNDCGGDLVTQRAHGRSRGSDEDDLLWRSSECLGELGVFGSVAPSRPDCMDVHSLSNIHDEVDVGIIVVVGSSRHLQRKMVSDLNENCCSV